MGEQLRVLKVIVVQGKRLVIRDFKSSDPYVVVKLGSQVLRIYISFFGYAIISTLCRIVKPHNVEMIH